VAVPSRSSKACTRSFGMCTPWLDLSDGVLSAPNGDCMQKLCLREVDVSTNHIGAHKPFGVSSFGVRVFLLTLYVKRHF
jgi:hypothetical protein